MAAISFPAVQGLQRRFRPARDLRYVLFALPVILTLSYFLDRDSDYIPRLSFNSHHGDSNLFWAQAFAALEDVKPKAMPVRVEVPVHGADWKPDVVDERPEHINMTSSDEEDLRKSHATWVDRIPSLIPLLSYEPDATGIVTTAGKGNFGQALTMVLMTRQAGSTLPIEIMLDSTTPFIDRMCTGVLGNMTTVCVQMTERWAQLEKPAPRLEWFQWKVIAILASSFQNVLFLDADTLPVLNPDTIFTPGTEPFTSTGAIFWPDFWVPSASGIFYRIAGDVTAPSLFERSTSESGVMVVDKKRHGDTMLLALYYNFFGPAYFWPLLSQGGPGQGDKETFLQAALVLDELDRRKKEEQSWPSNHIGATSRPGFWDVKKMPAVHGRTLNGKWKGMFMQQMDPVEDYRVVQEFKEKKNMEEEEMKQRETPPSSPSPIATPEAKGADQQIKPEDARSMERIDDVIVRRDGIYSETKKKAEELETREGPLVKPVWPVLPLTETYHNRFMFFHHNGVKLDFARILEDNSPIVQKDENGKYVRLWGDPGWIIERTGRDVEKDLWKAVTKMYCAVEEMKPVCNKLWEFVLEVI